MPSPWRLARKIHGTHHKVVIVAKIYCRDMVRIYNGRISVEKQILTGCGGIRIQPSLGAHPPMRGYAEHLSSLQ